MKRNDSICPLLTIAANADASNQGTAVPCDPEHCMLGMMCKTDKGIGWACSLTLSAYGACEQSRLPIVINFIEEEVLGE